jgi:ABC-type sulfate transport system permease component
MFLTSEGALLAVILAALVFGVMAARAALRRFARQAEDVPRAQGAAGTVRRVVVPPGARQRV